MQRHKYFALGLLLACLLSAPAGAVPPPNSVGAANYYEMKANPGYISLGVKGYQQTTDYTCGPAAVMSLLHWYHKLDASQLTAETEMRIAREMGTRPMESVQPGTTTEEMSRWLQDHGFGVAAGEDGSLEQLRGYLKQGIPVLVEWMDWGGHWVVVTGYYAGGEEPEKGMDTIFFADSGTHWTGLNNPEGITSFNAWRFQDMWFDAKYLNPGRLTNRVYIVAVPVKQ